MGQGLDKVKYIVYPTEPAEDMEYLVDGVPTYFNLDVGSLWFNSADNTVMKCTSTDPVTWENVGVGGAVADDGEGTVTVDIADDGTFSVQPATGGFGSAFNVQYLTEDIVIADAATSTSVIEIPANSVLLGVVGVVSTVIPTAADFDIGVSGTANRFGNDILVAADTPIPNIVSPTVYTSATAILVTPDQTPAAATGRIRVFLWYYTLTPPSNS